ncbi:MAG: di-heme oxidoredictase family protein [Rubrivivax sp.]
MNPPAIPVAGLRPRRRPWLMAAALTASLAALGWAWWHTELAWKTGYGNQDMGHIARADPRALSGGDMTNFHRGFAPFEQPADNLPWQYEAIFEEGDGLFDKVFVPGDDRTSDDVLSATGMRRVGLGPLFNAAGCGSCHFRDGRVQTPYVSGGEMLGMFLRVSVPDGKGGWMPAPGYHTQLRDKAVAGVKPEAKGHIDWTEEPGRFADGEPYSLRRPRYRVDQLAYGPLPAGALIEARTAPPVHGMGLLEAIDEADVLALERAQARSDIDGVRGRANRVVDPDSGRTVVGRFSLKANEASVRAQAAGAAFNDMGVTSPLHRDQLCLPHQADCRRAPHGGDRERPELSEHQLQVLTIYLQLLSVPARRDLDDPQALRGERLFREARCTACHVETWRTGDAHPLRRLRRQTIHPYSDLLLHDMGPGLAGRPDGLATATEWRTPPLWGIGLTRRSNHHTTFLHDQRARSLQEAVLWHGGQAEAAKQRFVQMNREDRAALLRFLESL